MKYMRIKYDTALQDVLYAQCFDAVDDEQAINTQVTLMWLLANPSDTVEWQLCKPVSDDADETTMFGWDMFAVLQFASENEIEVIDVW